MIKKKSIKTQIILTLMLVMGLVFLLLSYFASERLNELPEIVLEQYQEMVDARSDQLANEIKGLHYQIEMIAMSDVMETMDLERMQTYLKSLARQHRFRNFTVGFPDGTAWATYDEFFDISQQEQFTKIFIEGENHVISKPFYSPYFQQGDAIITMSHAIKDSTNTTIGLVNGVVTTKFVNDLVKSITFFDDGYAWIVGNEGEIIAFSDQQYTIDDNFVDITGLSYASVLFDQNGDFDYVNAQEQTMLNVYAQINNTEGWRFIYSIDKEVAFAKVYDVMYTINYSLLAALIILVLILLYLTNTITMPILKLKQAFDEASKGNLNVKANENIPNELGDAAKSFNSMLAQLKELTYVDPITGLNNFISFLNEMPRLSETFFDLELTCYVAIVSIDDFKRINSLYGYDIGNSVLRHFGERVQHYLKEDEIVARYFGDEMILSLYAKDEQDIHDRINWIIEHAQKPIVVSNIEVHLDVRCGIAALEPFKTMEDVIRHATIAKHKAKNTDNTHVIFYNKLIHQEIKEKQALEDALDLAIANEELYLMYQPIYDIEKNKTIGYEALLRWNHPHYSNIPISEIISLAESNGQIISIGQFVFTEALLKLKTLNRHDPDLFVSINVSALQLQNSQFVDFVSKRLLITGVNPKNVTIEITESATMLDVNDKRILLNQLRDLGISISIDDFGTGYSSLIYISKLPIHTIKIDKDFIQKVLIDDYAKTLITSILSIAKTLDLKVIAEGVESKEQLDAIYDLGCNLIQGYYIAKPRKM